jgi:hypothetical protein
MNCGQRQDEPPLHVSHRDYVSGGSIGLKESSNLNAGISVSAPKAQVGFSTGGNVGFREDYNAGI